MPQKPISRFPARCHRLLPCLSFSGELGTGIADNQINLPLSGPGLNAEPSLLIHPGREGRCDLERKKTVFYHQPQGYFTRSTGDRQNDMEILKERDGVLNFSEDLDGGLVELVCFRLVLALQPEFSLIIQVGCIREWCSSMKPDPRPRGYRYIRATAPS